jgi:hypothetical protein
LANGLLGGEVGFEVRIADIPLHLQLGLFATHHFAAFSAGGTYRGPFVNRLVEGAQSTNCYLFASGTAGLSIDASDIGSCWRRFINCCTHASSKDEYKPVNCVMLETGDPQIHKFISIVPIINGGEEWITEYSKAYNLEELAVMMKKQHKPHGFV